MILVTGANGLLGSYLCRQLCEEKVVFIALIRPKSDLRLIQEIKHLLTFHYGDITDVESLQEILPRVSTIIHCAAIVSYNKSDREKMFDVNVNGTKNLINLALSHDIEYFIHISSIAAIGGNSITGVTTENEKWQNGQWHTRYAQSKYLSELEVWRGMSEGLKGVILNPSLILGAGDWQKSSSRLFKYVWEEKPYYTEGSLNYVDVRDVAMAIIKLLHSKITEERFIANAGTITYKEFFEKVATRLNKKAPHIKAKPWMIKLALLKATVQSLFSSESPMITRETAKISKNKIYFDNTKIRNELNINFTPFSNTIDWVCEFYLKNQGN